MPAISAASCGREQLRAARLAVLAAAGVAALPK